MISKLFLRLLVTIAEPHANEKMLRYEKVIFMQKNIALQRKKVNTNAGAGLLSPSR